MRTAFIGSSGHVGYALEGLAARPQEQVVGFAPGCPWDRMERIAEACEAMGREAPFFSDPETMLKKTRPDAVVVSTALAKNAQFTKMALEYGCAVFSEKPLALTLEELNELQAVQQQAGKPVAAMFGIRYTPWFETMERTVQAGTLGDIRLGVGQKSYKLGVRPEEYFRRETYGGTIPWVAIHAVDWVVHLMGMQVKAVTASHSDYGNGGFGTMEATSALLMEGEAGEIATITADFLRPASALRHDDDRVRITGTKATLEARDGRVYLEEANLPGRRELPLPGSVTPLYAEFLDELAGQGACRVTTNDGFAMTRVCLAARLSADIHQRIVLEDL